MCLSRLFLLGCTFTVVCAVPARATMWTPDDPEFSIPDHPAWQMGDSFLWPMEIFTSNGPYADDPGVDVYFTLSDGTGTGDFTFWNDSTVQSSVTKVYWDDGSLVGSCGITTSAGVNFTEYEMTPPNVPGWNLLDEPFDATRAFTSEAVPPLYHNGINDGGVEWAEFCFTLDVADDYFDLQNELISGDLRLAVHLQGFADGSSESAVNVPEPGSLTLLALGGLALLGRRRR